MTPPGTGLSSASRRWEVDIGLLIPRGGGGGGRHTSQVGYWVWPLPPPGPLAFVCEWRAVGIPLTRVEVDAAPIIAAARRATVLWALPDPDPASQGGWSAY